MIPAAGLAPKSPAHSLSCYRPVVEIRDSDRRVFAVSSPPERVERENGVVFAGGANWNSLDDSRYENEDWYSQGILSG